MGFMLIFLTNIKVFQYIITHKLLFLRGIIQIRIGIQLMHQ